jgi:hypothetical protein
VQDGFKLVPSVTRVFHSSADMFVYLQAYEKDVTAVRPLVAYVTFFKAGTKAMQTPVMRVADGLDPKSHMLPIKLSFSLAKLKPGDYDCQVTILDPTTQKASFWQAPVMMFHDAGKHARCSTGANSALSAGPLAGFGPWIGSRLVHSNLTELGGTISNTNVDSRRRGRTSDGTNTV